MSDYFNCKVGDISIRIKSRKKHLNSLNHKSLSLSMNSRYSVINPDFPNIENILKNCVLEYHKKSVFHLIICK